MQGRTKIKKAICLILVVLVPLISDTLPGYAKGHGHGHGHGQRGRHHTFRGGTWTGTTWSEWDPWWWAAPYYPAYLYYYDYWAPPDINQEPSPVYVQPTPQVEEQSYWYFCPDSRNCYPYVKQCPKGWLKVVPPAGPPEGRE
jgi:hypothetical protein